MCGCVPQCASEDVVCTGHSFPGASILKNLPQASFVDRCFFCCSLCPHAALFVEFEGLEPAQATFEEVEDPPTVHPPAEGPQDLYQGGLWQPAGRWPGRRAALHPPWASVHPPHAQAHQCWVPPPSLNANRCPRPGHTIPCPIGVG